MKNIWQHKRKNSDVQVFVVLPNVTVAEVQLQRVISGWKQRIVLATVKLGKGISCILFNGTIFGSDKTKTLLLQLLDK